jgi:hypothetical protein
MFSIKPRPTCEHIGISGRTLSRVSRLGLRVGEPQMPSRKVEYCLENAARCERMAAAMHQPDIKTAYAESARQWRRLAEQMEHSEKEGAGIFVPVDNS